MTNDDLSIPIFLRRQGNAPITAASDVPQISKPATYPVDQLQQQNGGNDRHIEQVHNLLALHPETVTNRLETGKRGSEHHDPLDASA